MPHPLNPLFAMSQMSMRRSHRLQRRSPTPAPSLGCVNNCRARQRGGRDDNCRGRNEGDGLEQTPPVEVAQNGGNEAPDGAHGGNDNNDRNDPPPPPPPNLAEVMAQQTQLMAALVDSMNRRNGGGGRPDDFQRKLEGFLKLRPPTFDDTDLEPLAAHDWLREIEKKMDLTTCTDEECVGIAAHQLTGAARSWWDSYSDAHEDPEHITWDEFVEAFTEYHILEGVLDSKEDEFRNLR